MNEIATRTGEKRYQVVFDPSYCFTLHGLFSDRQVRDGVNMGTWPVGLIFKDAWSGRYYRVVQHLKILGRKEEALNKVTAYRLNAGKNPDLLGVRYEYEFWTHNQLVDEILRLAKKDNGGPLEMKTEGR